MTVTDISPSHRPKKSTRGQSPLQAWVSSLPDVFLACRDMSHSWQPHVVKWVPVDRVYRQVLMCERCQTERRRDIDQRGLVSRGYYAYPEGYLAPAGTGHLDVNDKGALRLEGVLRLVGTPGS